MQIANCKCDTRLRAFNLNFAICILQFAMHFAPPLSVTPSAPPVLRVKHFHSRRLAAGSPVRNHPLRILAKHLDHLHRIFPPAFGAVALIGQSPKRPPAVNTERIIPGANRFVPQVLPHGQNRHTRQQRDLQPHPETDGIRATRNQPGDEQREPKHERHNEDPPPPHLPRHLPERRSPPYELRPRPANAPSPPLAKGASAVAQKGHSALPQYYQSRRSAFQPISVRASRFVISRSARL